MRIKNKEIAEMLGISTTAVSLALNNRPGVSEETRRKVLFLAKNDVLGRLNDEDGKPGNLLLSVHKRNGKIINEKPFFSIILETAQQEAMKYNYTMMIMHFLPENKLSEYMDFLMSLDIDGVIVVATEMQKEDIECYRRLRDFKHIPIVLMDSSFDLEDFDSVELDNMKAVFRAMDYAVGLGHRNIGYLESDIKINNFVHSHDGFYKAIREYGLQDYDHPVITLPADSDGAYKAMNRFLKNMPKNFKMPTLFIADLDYIALGAMNALKENGYKIPEDVSLIGYDGIAAGEISDPPLTTTNINKYDIGRLTVDRLIKKIGKDESFYTTTQVSSVLEIRGSVADIRQR